MIRLGDMTATTWHLRLDSEQKARWEEVARGAGLSLAEFVRSAVEARIADRTSRAVARAVSHELLPGIEQMLDWYLGGRQIASSKPTGHVPATQLVGPPVPVPRAFTVHCDNAEFHREGVRCDDCGGSFRG